MMHFVGQSHPWVFRLAASFLSGAVFLRSILVYRDSPQLDLVMGDYCLLENEPSRVPAELGRLQLMTADALSQLRSLISQMRPPQEP